MRKEIEEMEKKKKKTMNLIKIFSNWGRSCLFEKAGFPCAINSSSVNHASFIESNVLLASSLEVSYFHLII